MTAIISALILAGATTFRDGYEGAPLPQPSPCAAVTPPAGYKEYLRTWPQSMYGFAYPSTGGGLVPLGSITIGDREQAGRYLSVPFVAQPGQYVAQWEVVQAYSHVKPRYNPARPSGPVYVTLSPCRGDFRLSSNTGAHELRAACRRLSAGSQITYTTAPSKTACQIEAGRTYYFNFVFEDPRDGLDPKTSTCGDRGSDPVGKCETGFRSGRQ